MYDVLTKNRNLELLGIVLIGILIVVVLPLALDIFRLNLVGKYLTYAFVAVGLVLCWGHTGILSLGQGVFFGLGGYCMAMYLKLEASTPEATKIQSTPGIPDFMDWNQLTELPHFWVPFQSLPLALIAVFAVPVLIAFILGYALFKRRVGGVYFAIITQALAAVLTILIIGRQDFTGGINGITDLRTLLGWDIRTDSAKYILYFVCCFALLGSMLLARQVIASKLGRILIAVRDKEERVRFSGYDPALFKVFVFCFAAAVAALGGAMFTLQVGFMSPSFVGIVPSIVRGQDTRDLAPAELDLPAFASDIVSVLSADMQQPRVDLYVQLLNERLSFIRDQDLFRAEVELTATILDSSGTTVEEKMWTENIETQKYEETVAPGSGRTLQRSFNLPPGKYTFVVQNRDVDTRKSTRISRPVAVNNLGGGSLSLSDILLVQTMDMTGSKAVITPNISANVGESANGFSIFFEAYRDSTIDSIMLIAVVRSIEGAPVRRDTMVKALLKKRNACFMNIETRNLAPGPYSLTVEARPLNPYSANTSLLQIAGATRTFLVRLRGLPVSIMDIDRAIDQLQYVAYRDLIDALKAASPESKKDRFLAYWKQKDPFPATAENELMEEYYSRIDFANKNFGHYQEGWRTDRGMVYVVFGPPNNIDRHPFDIDSKPYEIWTYYNLNRTFVFVDYNGFGDYRLQNPIWDTWMPRNR